MATPNSGRQGGVAGKLVADVREEGTKINSFQLKVAKTFLASREQTA
jgi:hypothetical protein